jgi:hypothetical protein
MMIKASMLAASAGRLIKGCRVTALRARWKYTCSRGPLFFDGNFDEDVATRPSVSSIDVLDGVIEFPVTVRSQYR